MQHAGELIYILAIGFGTDLFENIGNNVMSEYDVEVHYSPTRVRQLLWSTRFHPTSYH
jgi:hypothetical protein